MGLNQGPFPSMKIIAPHFIKELFPIGTTKPKKVEKRRREGLDVSNMMMMMIFSLSSYLILIDASLIRTHKVYPRRRRGCDRHVDLGQRHLP